MMTIYEWLWNRIGGEPWTHIIRESKGWSAFVILGLIAANVCAYKKGGKPAAMVVSGLSGAVLGHLYW